MLHYVRQKSVPMLAQKDLFMAFYQSATWMIKDDYMAEIKSGLE